MNYLKILYNTQVSIKNKKHHSYVYLILIIFNNKKTTIGINYLKTLFSRIHIGNY